MAAPSVYDVPAITAGTLIKRSFAAPGGGFDRFPHKYRLALEVYNRSQTTLIVHLPWGDSRRVASGDVVIIDEDRTIPWYQLDAVADTNADEVQVFEYGGLDEQVTVEAA